MPFEIILSVLSVFVLLLISAMLSGIEAAYLSASKAKLHAYAKEGRKFAALASNIRNNMEKAISTPRCQGLAKMSAYPTVPAKSHQLQGLNDVAQDVAGGFTSY